MLSTRTQPLFQMFVWTTSGSSGAPSAPVDTRFFTPGDSISRGLRFVGIKHSQSGLLVINIAWVIGEVCTAGQVCGEHVVVCLLLGKLHYLERQQYVYRENDNEW